MNIRVLMDVMGTHILDVLLLPLTERTLCCPILLLPLQYPRLVLGIND